MKGVEKIFTKLFDFYLYSSIHIAISATLFICQTYLLLDLDPDYNYLLFIGSSTLFLYLLHNILGLNTLSNECVRDKVNKIRKMKVLLLVMVSISALISLYSFSLLPIKIKLALVFFAFISIWYVIPIFKKGKRLRDYPIIKIFLVALVWAAISTFIPLIENEVDLEIKIFIFLEKYFFIFAITLPFDIRDIEYDKAKGVKTIPIILGKSKSIVLSIILIVIVLGIVISLNIMNIYSDIHLLALCIGYFFTIVIIIFSKNISSDYYFTGLIDSLAIIIFLMLFFSTK